MKKPVPLVLTRPQGAEAGDPATPGIDRYPGMMEAGRILGMSGAALRKKFERGDIPREYLLRVGPKTLRVDLLGLINFLKSEAGQKSA